MADLKTKIQILLENRTKQGFDEVNGSIDSMKSKAASVRDAMLGFFGISFSALFSKKLAEDADKWLMLNAQIKNATQSNDEFIESQQAIIDISRKTYTSLEANAGLFSKVNLAIKAMGGETRQSINTVDQVAKLVALSGTSAESAAAGIFQFTQSLAANRFSGQEYNSVAEQTPALLKAIYEGLGVNIGTLRKMAEEGALDTATILKSIENSTARTNAAFGALPITLGKSLQNVSNKWLEFVGRLNEAHGATATLAGGFNLLADNIDVVGKATFGLIAALGFAGAVRAIVFLADYQKALKLTAVETRANAVATAEAQYQEAQRIVALEAAIAVEQAEVRTQIVATEATITQTQAQIRLNEFLLAGTTDLTYRASITARLTVLNNELTVSTEALATQQRALAASAAASSNALTSSKLLTFTNLLNVAIAAVVSYEFGEWARKQSTWVEKLGIVVAGTTQSLGNLLTGSLKLLGGDFSGGVADFKNIITIKNEYTDLYKLVGNESIKSKNERAAAAKEAAKAESDAAQKSMEQIQASFQKASDQFDLVTEVNKSRYERNLRDLEESEKKQIAVIEQSNKDKAIKEAEIVKTQLDINEQRFRATKSFYDKQLIELQRIYDAEIAAFKKKELSTVQLEKDLAQKQQAILQDKEKAYEKSISLLNDLEKQHRDKAVQYQNEIVQNKKAGDDKLRELANIGASDEQKAANDRIILEQNTLKIKSLLRSNASKAEIQEALELAKKNQELAFEVASAEKSAYNKEGLSETGAYVAQQTYTKSLELTQQALERNKQAETANADEIAKKAETQKQQLATLRETLEKVNFLITTPKGFKVDTTAALSNIEVLNQKIDDAVRARTLQIDTNQVAVQAKNKGGFIESIKRFATGGHVPGVGNTDTVPAMLTPGEFVVTKAAAARLGANFLYGLNSGINPAHFASGGMVGQASNNQQQNDNMTFVLDLGNGLQLPTQANKSLVKEFINELEQLKRTQR